MTAADPYELQPRAQVVGAGIVNLMMGAWLVAAPYALGYAEVRVAAWNALVVGLLVMAVSTVRIVRPARSAWLSVANLVLGTWLIVAAITVGEVSSARLWNNAVVGAVVCVEASISLVYGRRAADRRAAATPHGPRRSATVSRTLRFHDGRVDMLAAPCDKPAEGDAHNEGGAGDPQRPAVKAVAIRFHHAW